MQRKVANRKIVRRLRGKQPKRDLMNLEKKNYLSHISTIIFHAGINYIKLVICEFIFMKILMRFSHNMTHSHAMTGIEFYSINNNPNIIMILFLQFFE